VTSAYTTIIICPQNIECHSLYEEMSDYILGNITVHRTWDTNDLCNDVAGI